MNAYHLGEMSCSGLVIVRGSPDHALTREQLAGRIQLEASGRQRAEQSGIVDD